MCTVSMIGDGWRDQFPQRWPSVYPQIWHVEKPQISREEFDALKHEMEELKSLLAAAKKFDYATGQQNCEMQEKVELIKAVAKMVGVDLSEIL